MRLKTDRILFITILAMVTCGIVMLYSASSAVAELRYHYSSYYFVIRQIGWAIVSFGVLMWFKRLDYRKMNNAAWAFSGLGIVLTMLLAVYFYDSSSHRWFKIKGIGSFQPSEFAKPALILFLAYFLARRSQVINRQRTLAQAFLAIAVLSLLVVASDLGTAMVPVIMALIVLWVAGLEKKILVSLACVGLLLGMVAIVSKGYRLDRVLSFIDPKFEMVDKIDPSGAIRAYTKHTKDAEGGGGRDASYQPKQSLIAVAANGVTGAGIMEGKQKLMFLPEAHTDYIFASIAEETGIFGPFAIMAGFLLILWRGARLFVVAKDDFGKYLALGVTVAIVIQALMNISVVLNLAPTKGFPLPLISFGGSSLLSTLICLGMLLSVAEHEG
jgi:cell division protein FtsW